MRPPRQRARSAATFLVVSMGAWTMNAGPAGAQTGLHHETARALAEAVALAWQAGDAHAVAELLAPRGVALELPGSSNPAVRPAQARAALTRVFEEFPAGPVEVVEVRSLGGEPEQGLARLVWRPGGVDGDTAGPVLPLFLALERVDAGWLVGELRLVRSPAPTPEAPGRRPWP